MRNVLAVDEDIVLCRLKVLATLAAPLLCTLFVSIGCAIYQGLRRDDQPDLRKLDLTLAYSTVSFALSLLLVFKTNTSYARFWEGAVSCALVH